MYIEVLTRKQSSNAGHNRKEREHTHMDQQEQQRLNQAAQEFTNALVESSRAAADLGVNVQEHNAQLTQEFFNRVIENLRTQAEDTRQMGQQLAEQQQRATEAGQTLTQESVNAYMDFVNSMFTFGQQGAQAAQKVRRRHARVSSAG